MPRPHRIPSWQVRTWATISYKEDRRCCQLNRALDPLNKWPVGWCGPTCEGRVERDRLLNERRS